MAAFEEIYDTDADLGHELRLRRNVFVNRPAYTEEAFQSEHSETVKQKPTLRARVKRKVAKCSISLGTVKKFVFSVVPILSWLPPYDVKNALPRDLMSGITVGIFRIPHGMAHAILADLSPIYGLYTQFFPPIVYALFGTSRQLNIGTFAVVSIMTGSAIDKAIEVWKAERGQMAAGAMTTMATITTTAGGNFTGVTLGPASYTGYTPAEEATERAKIAAMLAMLVGLMQIGMSVFRLGFVTCYLAEPLVRGFTTGAAFHVFTSQFNKLFGIPIPRYSGIFALPKTYRDFFINIDQTNVSVLVNSVICIFVLVVVKEFQDKYKDKIKYPLPTELVVIILSTVAALVGDFYEKYGMAIVGEITATSLPAPSMPPFRYASMLLSDAFVIAIVGFSVSVSLSFIFAKRNKYEVSSNQELIGYGASNTISSFFSCYPCSASLSRSLLQELAGGTTQIAGIISTMPILIVLFLLTGFFESLPVGCLAAIVVVALRGMFRQFKDVRELWRFSKIDSLLWIVTCLAVILLGVDIGLAAGVAFAIFTVILRTQRPRCCIMGHIPNTDIYRDRNFYEAAIEIPSVKIFRVNAPIYFTNAEYIKAEMYSVTGVNPLKIVQERAKEEKRLAKAQAKYKKANGTKNEGRTNGIEVRAESRERSEEVVTGGENTNVELLEMTSSSENDVREVNLGDSLDTNGIKTIIMDFGMVSFVDAMGLSTLKVIVADYEKVDINIILANCRAPIRNLMFQSGFMDLIGLDKIYITLHDAVLHSVEKEHHLLEGSKCRLVPEPGAIVQYRPSTSEEPEEGTETKPDMQPAGFHANI